MGSFGVCYTGIVHWDSCLLCLSVAKILQVSQLVCVVPSELLVGTLIYYVSSLTIFSSFSASLFEPISDISLLALGSFPFFRSGDICDV